MNPLDELTRLLPRPPADEELPRHQRHKAELLTIIAADRKRRRALRSRATRGWLVPAMAATAVAVVAVLAVVVSGLVGVGSGSPSASHGVRPGHSTGTTTAPSGGAPAPTGSRLTTTRRWSVANTRFDAITVIVNRGSVDVAARTASSAAITATPTYGGQAPVVSSQTGDENLSVTAHCPSERNCQVALTVEVPPWVTVLVVADLGDVRVTGLYGSVSATDHQGDIVLTDLSGHVSASDDLGDVTLTHVSGPVTASTQAGTINATNLTAAQVVLSSQEGDVTAAFAAPPTHVTASSQLGDVTLRLPESVTYDVIASTKLGSASITAPRSAGSSHVIRASSQLGSVTVAGVLIKTTINL